MKINVNNVVQTTKKYYLDKPFIELVNTVFTSEGRTKSCSDSAVAALIERLENFFQTDGFGNSITGEINEMEAFIACNLILSHDGAA